MRETETSRMDHNEEWKGKAPKLAKALGGPGMLLTDLPKIFPSV